MKLQQKKISKKRWTVVIVVLLVVAIGAAVVISKLAQAPPQTTKQSSSKQSTKKSSPAKQQKASFDKTLHSTSDPASLWVVVNKAHPLGQLDYVPSDLTSFGGARLSQRAAPSLQKMFAAASSDGVGLNVQSAYRSYGYQTNLYNNYVARDGQAAADRYSARPGHSEHQTGLALDVGGVSRPSCNVEQCFGQTVEGKWLTAHVADYGFIVRYTEANQSVTGYEAEPWHIRFVGLALAAQMRQTHKTTLEEFFGVSGGVQYRQ